jgi:hypothetical protein
LGEESVTNRCAVVGRREDAAPAAAADQDLAAAVGGSLEKERLGVAGRGEDRGHRSGRARPDHRHAPRTNCHAVKIRLSAERAVYRESEFARRLMKTIGILGGIGPESTVDYYRLMIAEYRKRRPDGSYPPIILNSINLTGIVRLVEANDFAGLTGVLVRELDVVSVDARIQVKSVCFFVPGLGGLVQQFLCQFYKVIDLTRCYIRLPERIEDAKIVRPMSKCFISQD